MYTRPKFWNQNENLQLNTGCGGQPGAGSVTSRLQTEFASTVWSLIEQATTLRGDACALLAPGREPLSYEALAEQTRRVAGALRAAGIGAGDRVAVVLPNGPEMASAFLAVASCAGCAPLNPSYTRQDFDFYLNDLKAKALLVDASAPAPALEAARASGIPVLTLTPRARAGEFDLESAVAAEPDWPGQGHTALLLHTSGTTSRPKLVPLSAANLAASAAHIAETLALTPSDRCLNIMPLFHIHGLVAAVLSSLHAGASVVCTDGVFASRFFEWLHDFNPTWYTAVPTMHQGILARAPQHEDILRGVRLRFIRSSSASLPPPVMEALERTFGAPVIEAYGMTEAAHQMASNPLPPRPRKPGSVGVAAGPEVAIMDDHGGILAPRQTGEVVIRGANVTAGYEGNPAANETAFTNGWFRTGDQGWIDDEGYLILTGRLKELINRGGEKIAPREVDEVLLAHPAVRQALAFAVPHAQLGEEIAAAVELRPGATAAAAEIRAWAAERLPSFKVPRLIRVVDAIPRGPTGKLQRIGLAAKLGIGTLDDTQLGEFVAPRSELEERIAGIWRELLPGARTGVKDRFEALGGDSLLAVRMLAAVSSLTGTEIPFQSFVEEGTIAGLARAIEAHSSNPDDPIVVLRSEGSEPPLVCLPGHDGVLVGFSSMASNLNGASPVWTFDFSRLKGNGDMMTLAAELVAHLRRRQPKGPYRLAGVCFGGCVALEMGNLLRQQGEVVQFLALIDTLNPAWRREQGFGAIAAALARQLRFKFAYHWRALGEMSLAEAARYLAGRLGAFIWTCRELSAARFGIGRITSAAKRGMMFSHTPSRWPQDALVIRLPGRRLDAPQFGWSGVVQGKIDLVDIPFLPGGSLAGDNAVRVAWILRDRLSRC